MPLDKWPCVPNKFSDILPLKLPFFLQTGATHALGRPVSIIDPQGMEHFDAFDKFDSFESFCRCLRGGCKEHSINPHWDKACGQCDFLVAKRLIADRDKAQKGPSPPVRYRCYMGLEEIATVISVGGLPVMVVSGQFLPPEGSADVEAAISCLGVKVPLQADISGLLWEAISRFDFKKELWMDHPLAEGDRQLLLSHAGDLKEMEKGLEANLTEVAQQIADIAQHYHALAIAKVEGQIMHDIGDEISKAATSESDGFWERVNKILEVFRRALDINYVAFYSGSTELETVLALRGRAGTLPQGSEAVTFNWRKAGMKTEDGRDKADQMFDWRLVSLSDRASISKGFRGGPYPFSSCVGLIPVKLPGGPFSLLVVGPHQGGADLTDHESFLQAASRRLSTRVLALQLSAILHADRSEWERTTKLTGHRVRVAIQHVRTQLRTIEGERNGEAGCTKAHRAAAERDLEVALKDLEVVSYAAESSIRGALDVKSASREHLPIGRIVEAAVEAQRDLAHEYGIQIELSDEIHSLPDVWVNPTLLRFAFLNLVNNGLKYSYPHPENRTRVLKIKPALADPYEVRVEIVNFGLGIKEADRKAIFDWLVRSQEGIPKFRSVYGKGIGLWETKHIIEGHGGKILVDSVHHSTAPVTDQNINHCITVFTVVLPAGKRPDV